MLNQIQSGYSLQLAAPADGVVGGQMYGVGNFIGVVVADAAEGEQFTLVIKGAFDAVKKKAGEAWSQGDALYYSADDGLTKTAGADPVLPLAGYAYADAASADVVGSILLK
ncbi:DUF2190 family protein [Arachidicoccus terrestris]|uniref:DUF2190 family protein n=1 Tax=Arachidicoccus terrestris TaxID=2875539 RepID=UPI001CC6AEB5|nr:DUF2190 family protein [Arachidicoccus terrestris]UAY56260.1 DUF2190 family protein [Arachidicoccus terrestris]